MYQYECMEDGCNFVAKEKTEEQLVKSVQKHMSEEHDSFELEEFITTAAEKV